MKDVFGSSVAGRVVFSLSLAAFAAIVLSTWVAVWDAGFTVQKDTKSYVACARQLEGGVNDRDTIAWRPPVYPLFLLAAGIPDDDEGYRRTTLLQSLLVIVAGGLLAWTMYAGWGSFWLASIPLWVLSLDAQAIGYVNTMLSESLAVVVILLLLSAFVYSLQVARGKSAWAWCVVGLLVAAIGLTRVQYAAAGLYVIPVAVALWRRGGTWRAGVLIVVAAALVPVATWQVYLHLVKVPGRAATRERQFGWVVLGKMIAPNFYIGPENSTVEQSVAMMWNESWRRGRREAEFPQSEWLYVRQNFPGFQRGPLKTFGLDEWVHDNLTDYDMRPFNALVRTLVLRSIRHNLPAIAGERLQRLWGWMTANDATGYERNFKTMSVQRLLSDVRHAEFRVVADTAVGVQWLLGTNHTWKALIVALLLLPGFIRARRSGDDLLFVAATFCFVLGDLLFIGLLYEGYKPRFKVLNMLLLWIANGAMAYWTVCGIWPSIRARYYDKSVSRGGARQKRAG